SPRGVCAVRGKWRRDPPEPEGSRTTGGPVWGSIHPRGGPPGGAGGGGADWAIALKPPPILALSETAAVTRSNAIARQREMQVISVLLKCTVGCPRGRRRPCASRVQPRRVRPEPSLARGWAAPRARTELQRTRTEL